LGKGLATKAARAVMLYGFEDLNLPRIVKGCSLNQRSIGYGKLGMHFEKMSTDHRGMRLCIMQRTS